MLLRLIRKMISSWKMMLCLLIGLIIASAMLSSVPIYTEGVLQRMLTKDLESYQISSNSFPGAYSIETDYINLGKEEIFKRFHNIDNLIPEYIDEMALPVLTKNRVLTDNFLDAMSDEDMAENRNYRHIQIDAVEDIENHIKILYGRMPSKEKADGVYEVMVNEAAVKDLDVVLDKIYTITVQTIRKVDTAKVKIVGVYSMKDNTDPFWGGDIYKYDGSFVMDYDLYMNEYSKENVSTLAKITWYYALDYHKIKITDINRILSSLDRQSNDLGVYHDFLESSSILRKYGEREKLLKTTLSVLQVPIFIMIIFYLFMVSQLIIEQEKNEIAVLKSRGASRLQIINGYFIQGLILSGLSLIFGPPLGLLLCNILGASNGFLEFVQRTRLPISLNWKAYGYSSVGIVVFMITMLVPAILATRTTIVQHKQGKSKKKNTNMWKKYYIDILLLALTGYGIYNYQARLNILKVTGAKSSELSIDPLLFLISTFFILGLGMLFLRIFPYIVKIILKLGMRIWGPVSYFSITNVARSQGGDQFLMLFLILSISIGIFNANSARTINTNTEEKIRYAVGADITFKAVWQNNAVDITVPPTGPMIQTGTPQTSASGGPLLYKEPPFLQYEKLDGVEIATKVFRREDAVASLGKQSSPNVYVMGIDPGEFGKTSWFDSSLLPYHWYQYLNIMSKQPNAFLVSSSFAKKFGAKLGDSINVRWGKNDYVQGIIFAFVDYWPTYNPYSKIVNKSTQDLIVGNLSYIQAKTPLEPYEVWLKEKSGATSQQIYDDMKKKDIKVFNIRNAKQELITQKNDPILQGTNGALTMGFIVTMVISTIGFLIYWILNIQKRNLQFGICRAIGLTMKEVIGMIGIEQLLLSISSIVLGIVIGGIASDLFIPLLQIVYSSTEQIPPFKITSYAGDFNKLYAIIGLMLLIGVVVLGRLISKIKIDQVLKLGED